MSRFIEGLRSNLKSQYYAGELKQLDAVPPHRPLETGAGQPSREGVVYDQRLDGQSGEVQLPPPAQE